MTSRRPKQGKPIESVELNASLRVDRRNVSHIRAAFPGASLKGGLLKIRMGEEDPARVAEEAKRLSDLVRLVEGSRSPAKSQKTLRREGRSRARK